MSKQRFLAVCIGLVSAFGASAAAASALATAYGQIVTPPAPVIVPPARDIAPVAPAPSYSPAPAASDAPVTYSPAAPADIAEAPVLPPEAPAYSDLCRAAPKPPWCEDKPATPRTP